MNWPDCKLVEVVPDKMDRVPVCKETRPPASPAVENVDAYTDEGFSLDQAIQATQDSFPAVHNGALGIRAILSYRAARERQSVRSV